MPLSSAIRRRATNMMALTTAVTAIMLVAGPDSANAAPAHAVDKARHSLAGTMRPGSSAVHREFTWKIQIPIQHPGQVHAAPVPNPNPAPAITTCELTAWFDGTGSNIEAVGQYACGADLYYMAIDVALVAADDDSVVAEAFAEGYSIRNVVKGTGDSSIDCEVQYIAAAQAATRFAPSDILGEGTGWIATGPFYLC